MLSTTHARRRSEGGFTLIELLVVMIIIAILMAVAVPTFLSQKNNALKTQATANIKQVINAMESCATQITQGGYSEGTGGLNCSDKTTLEEYEASLSQVLIQPGPPTAVNQTQVLLTGSNQGFIVQRMINDSGKNVFFAEIHTDAGQIYKLCQSQTAFDISATSSAPDPTTKTCKKKGDTQTNAW